MKKYILFTVTLLLAINCYSQDKGFIGFSIGSNRPIGDFASTDGNTGAGFAKVGEIIDISFGYKLGKYFGITGLVHGQLNAFDKAAFKSELAKDGNVGSSVNSNNWFISGCLFGGFGTFPISERSSFNVRTMIGLLNVKSPSIEVITNSYNYYNNETTSRVKLSSGSAIAVSYLVGAGFKTDVGKKMCLLATLDYLDSKPEFKNVTRTTSNGTSTMSSFSQKIGTMNFGFGMGIRL